VVEFLELYMKGSCLKQLKNYRDVPDIGFQLAGYLAIFYYPILFSDLAKMLNGTRYLYQIFYLLM